MSNHYHIPVLLQACIQGLSIKPDGIYVDLTFGGGGHSNEILKHLGPKGKLIAFDQDKDAASNVPDDKRFIFVPQNFRYLKNYLRINGCTQVDGILGDLGVSSHQFDVPDRGFSTRFDARLDMRMNQQSDLSAADVINKYDEKQLQALFRNYGEIDNASKLARVIIAYREKEAITTTAQLKKAINSCTPRFEENRYLAKVFQAIRMEVNQEVDALKECLAQCLEVLKPGGRLVIMSYHSIEDRIVKNMLKAGNIEGVEEKDVVFGTSKKIFKLLSSKPIVPDEDEIKNNSRARSAKLRIAEKI